MGVSGDSVGPLLSHPTPEPCLRATQEARPTLGLECVGRAAQQGPQKVLCLGDAEGMRHGVGQEPGRTRRRQAVRARACSNRPWWRHKAPIHCLPGQWRLAGESLSSLGLWGSQFPGDSFVPMWHDISGGVRLIGPPLQDCHTQSPQPKPLPRTTVPGPTLNTLPALSH